MAMAVTICAKLKAVGVEQAPVGTLAEFRSHLTAVLDHRRGLVGAGCSSWVTSG